MKDRKTVISFLSGVLAALIVLGVVSWCTKHISFTVITPNSKIDAESENEFYYRTLYDAFSAENEECEEIASSAERTPRELTAETYYAEDGNCHVLLDFYMESPDILQSMDSVIFYFEKEFAWSSDGAEAQLWVKPKESTYSYDRDLTILPTGLDSCEILLSQLEKQDFPCHIQMRFTAPWSGEEMPKKIVYRYRFQEK